MYAVSKAVLLMQIGKTASIIYQFIEYVTDPFLLLNLMKCKKPNCLYINGYNSPIYCSILVAIYNIVDSHRFLSYSTYLQFTGHVSQE